MFRFYISSLGSVLFFGALLVTSTISMFIFKHRVHSLKQELYNLDSMVISEKKRSVALEANKTLQHSSGYLKKIADSKLNAKFTTVKQFVAINELKNSNISTVNN